ncbi:hypothetical protein DAT35_36545 [Vitiosangium sp. GDMCC 1.1324]|nr:hypothetical protein DAT35_36545 [Vitiosangium sp. GDMCC 1.1324]
MYTPKTAADAAKSCGKLKGEAIGFWKYVKDPLTNPTNQLVIRPTGTASRFEYTYQVQVKNADGTPKVDDKGEPVMKDKTVERADPDLVTGTDASGKKITAKEAASTGPATLAEEPDASGLCLAEGFGRDATVSASAVTHQDTGEELVPAETITYKYTKVQVFSAAKAPGTQAKGEFTYSDGTGCTAEYTMLALWPQVPCVPGSTKPAESCGEGSGLNPDFKAVCVADIGPDGEGGCVPAGDVPSFN